MLQNVVMDWLRRLWGTVRRVFHFLGIEVHRRSSTPEAIAARLLIERDVDLVIDVGASTGQFGVRLRRLGYEGRIVSFEPLPEQHEKLRAQAERDDCWTVAPPMALGSTEGVEKISISSDRVSSSFLKPTPYLLDSARERPKCERCAKVRVSTLSHQIPKWAGGASRIFVKIDVQGYEGEVLAGAWDVLEGIVGFQVEVSLKELYEDQPLALDIMNLLDSYGFQLCGIISGLVNRSSGEMLQVDVVFMRRSTTKAGLGEN